MAPKKASHSKPDEQPDPTKREQFSFTIAHPSNPNKPIPCLRSGPLDSPSPPALIFTHGAGGTLSAPAVVNFTSGVSASRPMVAFQGSMNLPARIKGFHAVMEHASLPGKQVECLGGRSMGARAAVVATSSPTGGGVKFLILVSYPLQSEKGELRDKILLELPAEMDVLFVSGDGDTMCGLGKLNEVRRKMRARSWLVVVKGADHGMNVRGGKQATELVGVETGKVAAQWLAEREQGGGAGCRGREIWWDGVVGEVKRSERREDTEFTVKANDRGETEDLSVPTGPTNRGRQGKKAQPASTAYKKKRKEVTSDDESEPEPAEDAKGQDGETREVYPIKKKANRDQLIAGIGSRDGKQDARHRSAGPSKKGRGRMSKSNGDAAAGGDDENKAVTRSSTRRKKAT